MAKKLDLPEELEAAVKLKKLSCEAFRFEGQLSQNIIVSHPKTVISLNMVSKKTKNLDVCLSGRQARLRISGKTTIFNCNNDK